MKRTSLRCPKPWCSSSSSLSYAEPGHAQLYHSPAGCRKAERPATAINPMQMQIICT